MRIADHTDSARRTHAETYRSRRLFRKAGLVFGLASCLSTSACKPKNPTAPPVRIASAPKTVPFTIAWEMTERFGPRFDLNGDGRPDMPNSFEYVNPDLYEVRLAVRPDEGGAGAAAGISCDWSIEGDHQVNEVRTDATSATVRLPQGAYAVTAKVRLPDGRTGSAREVIRVKDLLIVAMGDSLVSGEGSPEAPAEWSNSGSIPVLRGRLDPPVPARWADGGIDGDSPRTTCLGILPPTNALHAVAHRSTRSGAAQLAMRIEAEDPHTSVTFVCLGASGTRIADLFATDRSGKNQALGPGPDLPPQLDELHAIVGRRPVDLLILSAGLNDARTFQLLDEVMKRNVQCIRPLDLLERYSKRKDGVAATDRDFEALIDPCERSMFVRKDADARRRLRDQDAALIYDLAELTDQGLAEARGQLEPLACAIALDPNLAGASVCVLEYPDPTGNDDGSTAEAILDDLMPGLAVNRRELDLVRERLLRRLNGILHAMADRHGWIFADGIFASFRDHGYSAKDKWFVTAKESEELQGPRLAVLGRLRGEISPGVLHPNTRGHKVIADRLRRCIKEGTSCHPRKVEIVQRPRLLENAGAAGSAPP